MSVMTLKFNDGADFGSVAHDAYRTLGKRYGWNLRYESSFEPRRLLYANGVTPEGYSVWFVAHSNFISPEDASGPWKNTFIGDEIHEEWDHLAEKRHINLYLDETERVVFAKKASGKYYFMGIYKADLTLTYNDENGHRVKIYKKLSTEYPAKT